jgi:DNA-binding SARP family transcriptional activator
MRSTAPVSNDISLTKPRFTNTHRVRETTSRNTIHFFGGFQVFNNRGEDITSKFSPLLKELFLLIWLHTLRNDKGISSDTLIEILWFGKSKRSARNNCSVNIAKLKIILSEIEGCELSHKTGYWKINLDESKLSNDYYQVMKIIESKEAFTRGKLYQLIEITNKGPFLVNLNYEWLDEFKAKISDIIVDQFIYSAQSLDIKEDAELIIHLSDGIFNFDTVNEEAMILKCKAQYASGKHSLAKNTYQKFFNEYRVLYIQDYNRSFTDILNQG